MNRRKLNRHSLPSWACAIVLLAAFICPAAPTAPALVQPATRPAAALDVRQIAIPSFPGAHAVWGGVGADAQGHIWIGASAKNVPLPSARMFEYDPQSDKLTLRGDVNSEMKRLGILREGERQQKIHSRIVQADDGHLYFTSFDEEGEKADGSQQPKWGGHLWRLRMPQRQWEHLLAAPEALIAAGASGKWVYALGYFDHVLYQFDCETGKVRSVRVGSVDGHISRNILVDRRGHVFVPRTSRPEGPVPFIKLPLLTPPPDVHLVEFDTGLREVGQTPLGNYFMTTPAGTHGITALADMADGSIWFTTHPGWLYRVTPKATGPSEVKQIGPFNPRGKSHSACLFTDGRNWLAGASRVRGQNYEWIHRDVVSGVVTTCPVTIPGSPRTGSLLLYGSMARDSSGACCIVGMAGKAPIVLRVRDTERP